MKDPFDKELLRKFVSNQCTKEELAQIRQFILEPTYREALEKILDQQWAHFNPVIQPGESDLQDWKTEFEQRTKIVVASSVVKPLKRFYWLGYAAAACLLLSFFIFLRHPNRKQNSTTIAMKAIVNPAGQRAIVTLPDSSVITLGPKSKLSYPEVFAANIREISLEGEAFFQVTKNPHKPFIIHTGDVQTKVLGTSFKIDALNGKPVCVAVATGKVSVSLLKAGKEQILATLIPGRQVKYNTVSQALELQDFTIADIKDWKDGLLSLNGLSINEAIANLERWYNVGISVKPSIDGRRRIKLVVDGKRPVNEALETIKAVTGLKYKIDGQQIQIY